MDWMAVVWLLMSGGIIFTTIMAELVRCLGQSFVEKLTALFCVVLRLRMSGLLLPGPHGIILGFGEKFICTVIHYLIFIVFFHVINFAFKYFLF